MSKKLKSSLYYQRLLQLVGRSSDILIFLMGYYLGKEEFYAALLFLTFRVITGYITSDLIYKRLKSSIAEGKKVKE